jgi:hypothetical protein
MINEGEREKIKHGHIENENLGLPRMKHTMSPFLLGYIVCEAKTIGLALVIWLLW